MEAWWRLPGPDRLASRFKDALADGNQVVMWSAPGTAPGLVDEVSRRLGRQRCDTRAFDLERRLEDPKGVLREILCLDPGAGIDRLAWDEYGGACVLITGVCPTAWTQWMEMLRRLEAIARNQDPRLRNRLLLQAPRRTHLKSVPAEVTIEILATESYATRFDAIAFVSGLLAGQGLSLSNLVRVSVIAGFALWDAELAERLARHPKIGVDDAIPILREHALAKQWDRIEPTPEILADYGIASKLDGREQMHSAWLAMTGQDRELRRRAWAAQVSVVFPALETRRSEIARECAGGELFPMEIDLGDRFEILEGPDDLDFGHLCRRYGSDSSKSKRLRDEMHRPRKNRNRIAHLEPLSEEDLLL